MLQGVREYIVWQVYDGRIDWFVLEDERYVLLQPGEDGVARSRVFPGLWLDVEAIWKIIQILVQISLGPTMLFIKLSKIGINGFAPRLEIKKTKGRSAVSGLLPAKRISSA
jgi:hypothetical protein